MASGRTIDAPKRPSNRVIKILVLGSTNVGKTSLIRRYCLDKFSDVRRVTVGADYMTKKISIRSNEIILQIWDTAGQERFHQGALGSAFYRGADGALLVYDVSNDKSFDQISHWRDEVNSRLEQDVFFPIVVVGNKIDLRREGVVGAAGAVAVAGTSAGAGTGVHVDQSELRNWCTDNGYGHIEASAKAGEGVQVAMEAIAALALDAQKLGKSGHSGAVMKERSNSILIDSLYSSNSSGVCGMSC